MANEVTSTSLSVLTTVQRKKSYKAKQKKNYKKKKWKNQSGKEKDHQV